MKGDINFRWARDAAPPPARRWQGWALFVLILVSIALVTGFCFGFLVGMAVPA